MDDLCDSIGSLGLGASFGSDAQRIHPYPPSYRNRGGATACDTRSPNCLAEQRKLPGDDEIARRCDC